MPAIKTLLKQGSKILILVVVLGLITDQLNLGIL